MMKTRWPEAVAFIPNGSEWNGGEWLNMLGAIKYESNGSERRREIALEWAEQHPTHDAAKFETAWKSLDRRGHPNPVGGRFIADHARKYGWTRLRTLARRQLARPRRKATRRQGDKATAKPAIMVRARDLLENLEALDRALTAAATHLNVYRRAGVVVGQQPGAMW